MRKQNILVGLAACWLACLVNSGCSPESELPAMPVLTRVMMYNGSPAFFERMAKVVWTAGDGTPDTLAATYNGLAHGSIEGGPIGAIGAATYFVKAPGTFRFYFYDSTGRLSVQEMQAGAESRYTVYLADSLGYFRLITTNDDVERRPGKALIRFLHLSPDAGPVKLYLDTNVVKGVEQVRYGQVTGYVEVPTTEKSGIRVTTAGKEEKGLSRKSFPLESGRCYTLILRGYINPPALQGDDAGENERIRQNQTIALSAIINQ